MTRLVSVNYILKTARAAYAYSMGKVLNELGPQKRAAIPITGISALFAQSDWPIASEPLSRQLRHVAFVANKR